MSTPENKITELDEAAQAELNKVLGTALGVAREQLEEQGVFLPFAIAVVDLEDGPRIAARIEGPPEAVNIGMRVAATYFDRESWTELRFTAQDN